MELINELPNEIDFNVIKFMKHPLAEIVDDTCNFRQRRENIFSKFLKETAWMDQPLTGVGQMLIIIVNGIQRLTFCKIYEQKKGFRGCKCSIIVRRVVHSLFIY